MAPLAARDAWEERRPTVLLVGTSVSFPRPSGFSLVHVATGRAALAHARSGVADVIVLGPGLPDLSPLDLCRRLRDDQHAGVMVPVLILAAGRPSPAERLAALGAGAWDFLQAPLAPDELTLQLRIYVRARRRIEVALRDGEVDPVTGLHSRPGMARRARELGALLARERRGLACIVFRVPEDVQHATARRIARAARLSDAVGVLGHREIAVLAPGTDSPGAVSLATRVGGVVGAQEPHAGLRAGYEAIANLTYTPLDPLDLFARASAAVEGGRPEPDVAWVRRYDPGRSADRRSAARSDS